MFQIGDKILYPAQGGGVIETIEEREAFGEKHLYYSISMPHRNMQVMIPVGRTEQFGIRHVVDPQQLDELLHNFHQGETELVGNDNQIDRQNLLKIRSGNIYQCAEVIRDLMRLSNKKKLGANRQNMLDNALHILVSEIALTKNIPEQQASLLLDRVIQSQS